MFLSMLLSWGCPMEEKFIFFPDSTVDVTPKDAGLAFEDVFFTTSDGVRLNGWFMPYAGSRITLLWFHGNAGNISHRLENIKLLHNKVQINVFIFDYRGYGRSEGRVSEEGTYRDGEAALKYLRNRSEKNRILWPFPGGGCRRGSGHARRMLGPHPRDTFRLHPRDGQGSISLSPHWTSSAHPL